MRVGTMPTTDHIGQVRYLENSITYSTTKVK